MKRSYEICVPVCSVMPDPLCNIMCPHYKLSVYIIILDSPPLDAKHYLLHFIENCNCVLKLI